MIRQTHAYFPNDQYKQLSRVYPLVSVPEKIMTQTVRSLSLITLVPSIALRVLNCSNS